MNIPKLRAPIVLVHGFCGFNEIRVGRWTLASYFRRIPGALQVPVQEVERHLGTLPRDREIILYCSCPNEASAAQAAKLLLSNGFRLVRPLRGGLDAWIAAGYAVEEFSASATSAAEATEAPAPALR